MLRHELMVKTESLRSRRTDNYVRRNALSRFKVFITRPVREEIRSKIAEECDVDMWHTRCYFTAYR